VCAGCKCTSAQISQRPGQQTAVKDTSKSKCDCQNELNRTSKRSKTVYFGSTRPTLSQVQTKTQRTQKFKGNLFFFFCYFVYLFLIVLYTSMNTLIVGVNVTSSVISNIITELSSHFKGTTSHHHNTQHNMQHTTHNAQCTMHNAQHTMHDTTQHTPHNHITCNHTTHSLITYQKLSILCNMWCREF
jgi:hypothetical protein